MEKKLKQCKSCGNTIAKKSNHSWSRYAEREFCSSKCCGEYQSRKLKFTCKFCGTEFERSPSHKHKNQYCSPECRSRDKTVTKQCEVCGKTITRPKSQSIYEHFYCSMRCQGMAKRKHRGQSQGRRSPEDLAWKREILKRGNYKCAMCGSTERLEAHHIKPIKDFPDLRHELENGMCVCHQCHYYGIHGGKPNFKHGRYSKK